jgi:Eukaryotic aspartyl protease.
MIFSLCLVLILITYTRSIPQNFEIDVVRVKLYRKEESFPPQFNGLNILASMIDREMAYYELEQINLPVFQESNQNPSLSSHSGRILGETQSGWTQNNQGRMLPPWNPREFNRDYLKLLTEDDKKSLKTSSRANYYGKIKLGAFKSYYDLQFTFQSAENIVIDYSCQNCSGQSSELLYSCEKDHSCSTLSKRQKLNNGALEGDTCETSMWLKRYDIEEVEVPFQFLLVKKSTQTFPYAGLISLTPNNSLFQNIVNQGLIYRRVLGLHYKSVTMNDDDSFLVCGGIEEHYKNEDFEYINFKLVDSKVVIHIEGLIMRKNQIQPRPMYGLQNYNVRFDESNLFISLPLNLLESIKDNLAQMQINCYIDAEQSPGVLICDKEKNHFPIISLIVSGREINIDPSIYAGVCKIQDGVKLCFTRLAVSLENEIELGEPFFMNYFVLFDYENLKIGLSYPKSQQIVDWSIFDNTIVLLILLILFGLIIIGGIICIRKRREERKRDSFRNLVEENRDKNVTIEMKK